MVKDVVIAKYYYFGLLINKTENKTVSESFYYVLLNEGLVKIAK